MNLENDLELRITSADATIATLQAQLAALPLGDNVGRYFKALEIEQWQGARNFAANSLMGCAGGACPLPATASQSCVVVASLFGTDLPCG